MIDFIIYAFLFLIGLEVFLYYIIHWLRRGYQWLITSKDINPILDHKALNKFIKNGYDPELGWVRKPGTSGVEKGRYGNTSYHINDVGSRVNPGFETKRPLISIYGDSFAFSRQVNDNETIAHYVSQNLKELTLNFGVGNYGIDQALIRLKREYDNNPTKIVIMGVVPETISRVLNVWKHYHEYGNTFGFKPRYYINEKKQLSLIENIIDSEDKFYCISTHLQELQHNDYFFNRKFVKDMLKFPYMVSLFNSRKRNLGLIYKLLLEKLFRLFRIRSNFQQEIHNEYVLKRNIEVCAELYQDKNNVDLLIEILKDFKTFCEKKLATPVFLFMPQLNDIYSIKKDKVFYQDFIERASMILPTIDITDTLLEKENVERYYSSDVYGGHFCKEGNFLVASVITDRLKQMDIKVRT